MNDANTLAQKIKAKHRLWVIPPQGIDPGRRWCHECEIEFPCDAVRAADMLLAPEKEAPATDAATTLAERLRSLATPTPFEAGGHKLEAYRFDALANGEIAAVLTEAADMLLELAREKAAPKADPKPLRCNMHGSADNCRTADETAVRMGLRKPAHCHDDCCEECFGN